MRLLSLKYLSFKNSLLYGKNRRKKLAEVAFFLALAGGLLYLLLTRLPRGRPLGPTGNFLLAKGLQIGFLLAFFYMLIGGINVSVNSLYLSSDLDLLRACPIDSRSVFTYKFVAAWIDNSSLVFSISFPLLIGYGIYTGVGPVYYLLMVVGFFSFTGFTTGLATMLTLFAVRFSPPNRLRRTFQVLGGLVGAALYAVFYIIFYTGNSSEGLSSDQLTRLKALFSHPAVEWLPGGWLASSLSYFAGRGELTSFLVKFSLLLVTAAALFLMSRTALVRSFAEGMATVEEAPAQEKERSQEFALSRPDYPPAFLKLLAVAKKEGLTYLRGYRAISSLWYLLAMSVVAPIIVFVQSGTVGSLAAPYFGYIVAWLFLYLFGAGFSSLAVFSERGNTSGIFSSPIAGDRLVLAKVITYFVPTTLVAEVYFVVGGLLVSAPILPLASGVIILPIAAFGVNSLGISLAFSFGRPNVVDPKKCFSPVLRFLNFPIVVFYLGVIGGAVVCLLHPEHLPYLDYFGQICRRVGGGILILTFPLAVSYLSINLAGARLLNRDW